MHREDSVKLGAEGRLGGVVGVHDELSFDLQLEASVGHAGRDIPGEAGRSLEPRTEGQDRRVRLVSTSAVQDPLVNRDQGGDQHEAGATSLGASRERGAREGERGKSQLSLLSVP